MLVDSYYLYQKQEGMKSGFYLVEFTEYYEPLHRHLFLAGNMAGKIGLYKCSPPVNAHSLRQPSFTLSGVKSARISGIFFPSIHHPNKGFGDVQGTSDVLLIKETPDTLMIFVLKGRKSVSRELVQLWIDGELSDEMKALILQAIRLMG